jgi:hypothetical protein
MSTSIIRFIIAGRNYLSLKYLSGEAEYWLECLHSFAEKKLQPFFNPETTKNKGII